MHNELSIILLNYLLTHQSLLIIQIGVGARQLSRSTEDIIPSVQHYDASQPSPPLVSVWGYVCMCMCMCVCVRMHVRHVCMYGTCTCAHMCVHIITNVFTCVFTCVYVCVCMYVYVYVTMFVFEWCVHMSGCVWWAFVYTVVFSLHIYSITGPTTFQHLHTRQVGFHWYKSG